MNISPQGLVSVSEILAYLRQDRYLSLSETVAYINLSERTIREHLPEIPHFRVGSKLLFKRSELDSWVQNYRENSEDLYISRIADEAVKAVLGSKK